MEPARRTSRAFFASPLLRGHRRAFDAARRPRCRGGCRAPAAPVAARGRAPGADCRAEPAAAGADPLALSQHRRALAKIRAADPGEIAEPSDHGGDPGARRSALVGSPDAHAADAPLAPNADAPWRPAPRGRARGVDLRRAQTRGGARRRGAAPSGAYRRGASPGAACREMSITLRPSERGGD